MQPRIMVVDDDLDARKALCSRLRHAGYDPVSVGSGRQAIEEYDRLQPDLVFLDASMPDVSGFEVCRHIKEHVSGHHATVALVTGVSTPSTDYVQKCASLAGADHFLSKPYDGRRVVELVDGGSRESSAGRPAVQA